MKRLLTTVIILAVLTACAVDPARYRVTDKYGNVNCLAAGDYATAQAMQDMYLVVNMTYQGRARESTLVYLTRTVQASAERYCMRGITSVKLEDVLSYASSAATAQASRSVSAQDFVQDSNRAAEIMAVGYVMAYDRALTNFSVGSER
jgi:hypothetical protein